MSNKNKNLKQIITDTLQTVDELMECVNASSAQMAQLRLTKWNLERILDATNQLEKLTTKIYKHKKHRAK